MKDINKKHEHNYNIIDSSEKIDEHGFTWVISKEKCDCDDLKYSFYNKTVWGTIILPPDLNRIDGITNEYKIK